MKAQDLKNSILQLAMEGKLVPQDPSDESASVLLDRIREEKEQLIKDKKIKRNNKESFIFRKNNHFYEKIGKNGEPVCIDDEIPFDIPETWEWCRLSTVNNIFTGNSINKTEKERKFTGLTEGYNYIATKDVKFDSTIDYNNGIKIPKDLEKFKIAAKDSVLLCIEGGSAGRKIAITEETICFGNKLACFTSYGINNKFLFYYLQNPLFIEVFKSKTTGIIGGVGINKLRNLLLPIPPFNEQERIVKKIDELSYYVEKYDYLEKELTILNDNFPELIKKSILQEAIQGKLVPQDSSDESASVLLDRIREEKEQLIKDKKIKRNNKESFIFRKNNHFYEKIGKNGEPVCIDDEIPFEIPENWEWTRLDNIGIYKKGPFGSALTKSMFVPKSKDSIKVYEQKNAIKKNHEIGKYYITKDYYETKMKGFTVEPGDILVSCAGTIGETYVLPENCELGIINQALMRMKIVDSINLSYFLIYFDYIIKNVAIKYSKGSAIKNIPPFKIFKKILIPIPPLSEQKKIVLKINAILNKIKNHNPRN